ncbi:MAG: hypothetical protein IPI83_13245 [Sphingomonadales bacterium]|nr:hypothetical protein [Sphingomonadales bacterium]
MDGFDDATGFKKPPREHRFKKGQSGIPEAAEGDRRMPLRFWPASQQEGEAEDRWCPAEMTTLQVILSAWSMARLRRELPDVHKFIAMINKLMPDVLDEAPTSAKSADHIS